MKATYRVRGGSFQYCVDQPLTALAGHPYQAGMLAGLGLYNRPGSGKIIKVTGLLQERTELNSNHMGGGVNGSIRAVRLNSYEAGEPCTVVPVDSDNAAVPALVKVEKDARASAAYASFFSSIPNSNFNTPNALNAFVTKNSATDPMGFGRRDSVTTQMQNITLNEDEGFAIAANDGQIRIEADRYFEVCVTFKIGSETYMAYNSTGPIGEDVFRNHIIQIWNTTGSGVVVEILDVDIMDNGDGFAGAGAGLPYVTIHSLETISYLDPNNKEAAELIKCDSDNPDLTGIDYGTNCRVHLSGNKTGAIIQRNQLLGIPRVGNSIRPGTLPVGDLFRDLRLYQDYSEPVILRGGEGLALIQRSRVRVGRGPYSFIFTVENDPATKRTSPHIGL